MRERKFPGCRCPDGGTKKNPHYSRVQVEAAKAAVGEAENVAKQLAEAAARARGEVDAARANLKETAPQVFEAKSLESQVSLVACSRCLAALQLFTLMCCWRKGESYGPLLKSVHTGNQLRIASMTSQHLRNASLIGSPV